MPLMNKRSALKLASLSALAAAAALVGCGKKEEPVAPAAAPAASAAPKPEPLKVAFAYIGPVGDGGWTLPTTTPARRWKKSWATRS